MTHADDTVSKDCYTGERPFEQHTLTLTKANRLDDARGLSGNCKEDDVDTGIYMSQNSQSTNTYNTCLQPQKDAMPLMPDNEGAFLRSKGKISSTLINIYSATCESVTAM